MIIKSPFKISARLLPALQIGGAWISMEVTSDTQASYYIYLADGSEVTGDDIGCRAGLDLQSAFSSLLTFLGAFAEAIDYETRTGRESENADLFPASLAEWATQNSDEIGIMSCELKESNEKYFA